MASSVSFVSTAAASSSGPRDTTGPSFGRARLEVLGHEVQPTPADQDDRPILRPRARALPNQAADVLRGITDLLWM